MTPTDAPQGQGHQLIDLFVRRLPDEPGRRRPNAWYEVGRFLRGSAELVAVEKTKDPTRVLVHAGVHTSDVWDYVHNADADWRGEVGPWRAVYPGVGPA